MLLKSGHPTFAPHAHNIADSARGYQQTTLATLSAMRLHIAVNRSGVCIALIKVVKATPQRSKLQLGFKTLQSSEARFLHQSLWLLCSRGWNSRPMNCGPGLISIAHIVAHTLLTKAASVIRTAEKQNRDLRGLALSHKHKKKKKYSTLRTSRRKRTLYIKYKYTSSSTDINLSVKIH